MMECRFSKIVSLLLEQHLLCCLRESLIWSLAVQADALMLSLMYILISQSRMQSDVSEAQPLKIEENILSGYSIKLWKTISSIQWNKPEVVKFIVSEWKKPKFTSRLGNKVMFVTQGSKCWKFTATCTSAVPELECNHKDADTRIVLHAKHVNSPVVVNADDTDVIVLLISQVVFLGPPI